MVTMAVSQPMGLDDFCGLVAKELQIDRRKVTPSSSFLDDLMVDSIRLVELMLRLEELGMAIPFEEAWDIVTVEDAYRRYQGWAGVKTDGMERGPAAHPAGS